MSTANDAPASTLSRLNHWVTKETTGGALLMVAAVAALVWANSRWAEQYHAFAHMHVGWAALHLDLSLAHWAADGLLAVFFFMVGLELKHEISAGSLGNPRTAAVPVFAAMGGMAAPALIFTAVIALSRDHTAAHGWAIPTATDIAFALAVLAVFGRGLPRGVRIFLMTLAVVDDLLAIIIIALFYSSDIQPLMLLGTAVAAAAFGAVVRTKASPWWLLLPLGVVAWWCMLVSGVHATIAGVVLGLTVPAHPVHGEHEARTESIQGSLQWLSSGFVLPLFAFFSAGVTIGGEGGSVLGQPVVLAIVLGLVLGKLIGVWGTAAVVTRFTHLRLPDAVGLRDLIPIGLVCGMGFTVSLLVADLSFPDGEHTAGAKIAVLLATFLSAVAGAVTLRLNARRKRLTDMNRDGRIDRDISPITGEEHMLDGSPVPDEDTDLSASDRMRT